MKYLSLNVNQSINDVMLHIQLVNIKKSLKVLNRVIRSRNSMKDRQYNAKNKKDKMTNNDVQNITQNTTGR